MSRHTYTPEHFDTHLAVLTDPSRGAVEPTPIHDVYDLTSTPHHHTSGARNLVVIAGPSGVGKDSIIQHMLRSDESFVRAKTATTRAQRPTESPDDMTWMQGRHSGESDADYKARLVESHDLVEASLHHGDVYGLPRSNLAAVPSGKIPLLNTDTTGVTSLRASLAGTYNMTSVMVCPDSARSLEARLSKAGRRSLGRLSTALGYLKSAPGVIDYVLINRESSTPSRAAAESAKRICWLLGAIGVRNDA